MDPNSGHLIDTSKLSEDELANLKEIGYLELPSELRRAATLKLAGQPEATVSLTSGGKLSRFAARKRKRRRKKGRRSYIELLCDTRVLAACAFGDTPISLLEAIMELCNGYCDSSVPRVYSEEKTTFCGKTLMGE